MKTYVYIQRSNHLFKGTKPDVFVSQFYHRVNSGHDLTYRVQHIFHFEQYS